MGNTGTIYPHKGKGAAIAALMYCLGKQLFTSTAFTGDQNSNIIVIGNILGDTFEINEPWVFTDNRIKTIPGVKSFFWRSLIINNAV